MAVDGSGIVRGYLPELVESPEVIETDVVAILGSPSQPLHPPLVAPLLHHIPAVKGISPALSSLAKEIRRNSGHDFRFEVRVEAEQLRVSPDISTIVIYE